MLAGKTWANALGLRIISVSLVIVVLCFGPAIKTAAQKTPVTDSLYVELEKANSDSMRLAILRQLSFAYSGRNPVKSAYYAKRVIADSALCSFNNLTDVYRYLGYAYLDQNRYDSALIGFTQALRFASKIDNIPIWISTAQLMSSCHRNMGNIDDAFKIAFRALRVADSIQDYRQMAQLNNQIGELYRRQNEADKAIKYLEKAYSDFETADIEGGMLGAKANLALAYKQVDPEKALDVYQELLTDFNHLFRSWDSARVYSNLANINLDLKRYNEAEGYLLKALECHKRIDKPISLAFCYKELGELYIRIERPSEVVKYSSLAMDIANQFGHHDLQYQTSRQLADAHALLGEHEQAHQYLKQFVALRDSVLNEEKIELSNELEAKYSAEKKEQQIKLQEEQLARQEAEINKQQILRKALLGGLVLLLIIAVIIFRNSRLQARKNREIQQFASQIQALQATQSRWFTNIAHELRTPLTLILGPIQNLLRQPETSESAKSEIQLAKKYGDQLVSRVNEILEISRLESGKLQLHQHPTNIITLLKQATATFESLASESDVDLQFRSEVSPVFLNIDANKITTIVNNLVANAIKFTPSGKAVKVELGFAEDESVQIKVVDAGIGISRDDLPHVFERFYQSSAPGQKAYGGSGVGLTLSQELAKFHGGIITVSSEIHKGSTFLLSLPSTLICEGVAESMGDQEVDELEESEIVNHPEVSDGSKPKILLVEDHPDMRKYIGNLLQPLYEITEAEDGNQALKVLEDFQPDLIISDVKMPGMDGLTFAKKLKDNEKFRLTPFINLTAHANEKDKLIALKTGVDDYLVKPFDAEELLARVHNLITNASERKKALEELVAEEEPARDLTHDEQVMRDLESLVQENLSNSSFSVTELAERAAMSSSSLSRHVKKMTGLTPGKFIRDIRLQKAIQLLESQHYPTIAEVVYAVGFEDVSSFSRLFKGRFGKSPSGYLAGGSNA